MKVLRRIRKYHKSHIKHVIASVFLLFFCVFLFTIKIYLEKEYKNYLIEETMKSQKIILNSVGLNLEYTLKDIIGAGSSIAADRDIYRLTSRIRKDGITPELKLSMDNELNRYTDYSKWILGMCLSASGDVIYQYDKIQMQKSPQIWNEGHDEQLKLVYDEMTRILQHKQVPKMVLSLWPSVYGKGDKPLIHISFPFIQVDSTVENSVMLTLSVDKEIFRNVLAQIDQNSEGMSSGYIVNQDNTIIYHHDPAWMGVNQDEYQENTGRYRIQKPISIWGLELVIDTQRDQLLHTIDLIHNKAVFFFICIFGALLVLLFLVLKNVILRPIQLIIWNIEHAKMTEARLPIAVEGNNEIWQIADALNHMMDSLEESYSQIKLEYQNKVTALKKQREAEGKALESQISAHFICNTLNVINYEAMDAGDHKVSVLLKKLSNILRYTFDQKHQTVHFYQELAWVEQYLYLQQVRYEGMFEYEIRFPEELQEWTCRKLMLQPFVENSIIHGFEGRPEGGRIVITGELTEGDALRIRIEDNGTGMDSETEAGVKLAILKPYGRHTTGIGISNVAARIYSYYGEKAVIHLENKPGEGCSFIFELPCLKGEENENYNSGG